MNDPAIRALLYPRLTGGVFVDELPTGTTRADVVHITPDFMHGYEVKGDHDTLVRVPNQLQCYREVYDFVTFIVTARHLPKLLPLLPEWVGILIASEHGLAEHRPALYNSSVEKAPLAALLLQEEVKQFLMSCGLPGVSRLRNADIAKFLRNAHFLPLSQLARYVREQLTLRLPTRLQIRAERKAERQSRLPRARKPRRKAKAAKRAKAPVRGAQSRAAA
ncbi:sce7726 family protein [Hymenobacter sp. BT175]|uniref:sce7726 family protein n=1 Tax=Hymenobacter translucens TaxID=2886507 RepID=UPI001D0EF594|nr:sce7726 family protein [Hymenobacter translucens]MCC2545589.1 sce7726 family protein [Hymenobacter translucens]